MKIAITADSVVDLSEELKQKYDIKVIPLCIFLGDKDYLDGELTSSEIYDYVAKTGTLPKTGGVNEERFNGFFEEILKEYDAIIHFDISSEMSVTYTNAVSAAKNFEGKVRVVDTRSLSTGMALLALYARKLTENYDDIDVITDMVEKRISSVQASFVIEKLDYLYKGGRCSSLALLGANILKIRPQIVVANGKMGSNKKYRGKMTEVVRNYCNDVLTQYNKPDKSIVFITHSDAEPEMVEVAYKAVKEAGFENIYETHAGCTVSSHCGKNTLGILYINDAE